MGIQGQGLNVDFNVQKTNIIRDFLEDIEEEPAPRYHSTFHKSGCLSLCCFAPCLLLPFSPLHFFACDSCMWLHADTPSLYRALTLLDWAHAVSHQNTHSS